MATPDVARTLALAGLSLMSFAALAFHALWRAAYPNASIVPNESDSLAFTTPQHLKESQYKALSSKIEAMSTIIANVNSTLHSKIDKEIQHLFATGGNWQRQPQFNPTPVEIAWISSSVIVPLWFVGLIVFHENAKGLSKGYKGFVARLVLIVLLAANGGLVVAFFGAEARAYVYVLYIVWPLHVSMAVWVLTRNLDLVEKIEKVEKAEKVVVAEKEKEKDK